MSASSSSMIAAKRFLRENRYDWRKLLVAVVEGDVERPKPVCDAVELESWCKSMARNWLRKDKKWFTERDWR